MDRRLSPLIAFDLDGTIAHTEAVSYADAVDLLQTHYNLPITMEIWYARYHGMAGPSLINALNADFATDLTWADYLHHRRARVPAMLAKGVNPAPGVLQVIRTLHTQGHPIALASNSDPTRVSLTWQNLTGQRSAGIDLAQVFAAKTFNAISDTGTGRAKPAPDIYLNLLQTLHLAPHQVLAVEDSPIGVAAATAAGIPCWGYVGLSPTPEELGTKLKAAGAKRLLAHWDDFLPLLAKYKLPKPKA